MPESSVLTSQGNIIFFGEVFNYIYTIEKCFKNDYFCFDQLNMIDICFSYYSCYPAFTRRAMVDIFIT